MTIPILRLADAARTALGARFDIGHELGSGGQGAVFRARRHALLDGTPTDDAVALKIHFDPQQDTRIAREIAFMEAVRHPSLATLLEHGELAIEGESMRYIAWEFVPGASLSHRLGQGPLASAGVAAIGRDVARAMLAIMDRQIVHRDINPKNVMIRTNDAPENLCAVLIDLGCARHLDRSTLTGAWDAVGTPGYMSPEQSRGEHDLTCFSDVFSLGLTLTEALTARHPANHRQDLVSTMRLRASTFAPDASTALVSVLDRMLELRPAFRPNPAFLADEFARLATVL